MLNAVRYFFVSRETFCPDRLDSPNIPPNQMTLLAFPKMQPDNVHPTINARQTLPNWSFLHRLTNTSSYQAASQYSSSKATRLVSHRKSWLCGKDGSRYTPQGTRHKETATNTQPGYFAIVSRETFFPKKHFLARQSCRISSENSEISFGLTPERQLKAGKGKQDS